MSRHTFAWSGRTVTLGVLDDVAVEAFTDGDCSTFALALNMLIDGEIMAVVQEPDTDQATESHFVVRVADGSFVDVEGTIDEAGLLARWSQRLKGAVVGVRPCNQPYMRDASERADLAAAATIAVIVANRHRSLTAA